MSDASKGHLSTAPSINLILGWHSPNLCCSSQQLAWSQGEPVQGGDRTVNCVGATMRTRKGAWVGGLASDTGHITQCSCGNAGLERCKWGYSSKWHRSSWMSCVLKEIGILRFWFHLKVLIYFPKPFSICTLAEKLSYIYQCYTLLMGYIIMKFCLNRSLRVDLSFKDYEFSQINACFLCLMAGNNALQLGLVASQILQQPCWNLGLSSAWLLRLCLMSHSAVVKQQRITIYWCRDAKSNCFYRNRLQIISQFQ